MSSPAIIPGLSAPYPALAATAEDLRRYLMSCAGCGAAAGMAAAEAVPPSLVDVRRVAPGLVTLPAPSWSDPELRFLVRPEVAERLREAAAALPSDVRIGFWEGLRPLSVQRVLWTSGLTFLRATHPELSGEEVELVLEMYVARPVGHTPHGTGCAVDVAPVDVFGRVLSPADAWGALATEVLSAALRNTGLFNYQPEWWHWSYGDAEWARANDCPPLVAAAPAQFDGSGDGI